MFKMGCSMARKILAIDGKGSSSSASPTAAASAAVTAGAGSSLDNGSSNSKKPKETPTAAGGKQEELNDFSKLEEDPRLPLNVRQIFKITKSWKAIARTMSKTGTAMFLNLFEQNQDLFYLFERFQHLKGKELHESMELREHAATVMSTLDQSINSLSDYDNFVNYLHSIGKLHHKVPGFKREHFWKIEQPFLKAVKQTLDERCNETIEEIYRIAIKLIIETISEGYGEDRPDVGGDSTASGDNSRGHNGSSGPGHKSTDSHDKGGAGQSEGGGAGSAGSSANKETAAGRQTTASFAGQLQQRATIRGRSGENTGQENSLLTATATPTEAPTRERPSTVRDESGKQVPASGCVCPIQLKHQKQIPRKNQGRRIDYKSDIENDSQPEEAAVTKSEQLDRERPEDRLKTTIICLKELLSLAVEGVSVEQQQQRHSERDIVAVVGCERKETNKSKSKTEKGLGEETESEMLWSGGNRSVKAQTRCQPQNEWAALIGCGGVSANDKLEAPSSPANNEGQQQSRRQQGSGRKRPFWSRLFGLDRSFIIANRARKGSPSLGLGYISSQAPAEPRQAAAAVAAAAAPAEPDAGQFTTSGQTQSASRGKSAHLIERGRLNWWQRLNSVIKRRQQQRSLGRNHTSTNGDRSSRSANKDNSSESPMAADLVGSKSCSASLASGCYQATSKSNGSCRRPKIAPLSRPTPASDVDATEVRRNYNNNDIRSCRTGQRQRATTKAESPRSIGDKATETAARRRASIGSGCQLTTWLAVPTLDGDATGNGDCSWLLSNRYSTRPCNETISRHHQRESAAAAAGRLKLKQRDGLIQAATPAPLAATADMHPRDHNNDRKYNLEARPNEQNNDDETSRRGEISNGCPLAPTRCPVEAAAAPRPDGSGASRWFGGAGFEDDCNCDSDCNCGGVCLSSRRSGIRQPSSSRGKTTGGSTIPTTRRRLRKLLSRALEFPATESSGSAKLDPNEQQQRQNRPEVNENEDSVLRVTGAGDSSERNQQQPQQSMGARIGKGERRSQFASSGCRRHDHQEQKHSDHHHHRTGRPSCLECPLRASVEVEATAAASAAAVATGLTRGHNKYPQSKKRAPSAAAAAKSPVSRLTGNAGDLGELIKMLMLALLTTSIGNNSDGNRQPDEPSGHNHAQQQPLSQELLRPISLTMQQ